MKIDNFSFEELESPNKLAFLASEMPNKCLVIEDLDRPLFVLTQETRGELPEMSVETCKRLEGDGYPKPILDAIESEAEANIYEDANLEPGRINGKDVLVRNDIDYDNKDIFDFTNLERMEQGKAPLDVNGKPIELHHIGQKQSSPLAELTSSEHRCQGNDNILHNKLKESEINREDFTKERIDHWKARAEQIKVQQD